MFTSVVCPDCGAPNGHGCLVPGFKRGDGGTHRGRRQRYWYTQWCSARRARLLPWGGVFLG